jgi:uncharacterized repeat protein (TIGR01451 family)
MFKLPLLRRRLLAAFLLALIGITFSLTGRAQTYVYVNNQDVANSVAGFSVSPNGALTPVPGSPYLTGGVGSTSTCQSLDRIITSAANDLLLVSNSGDQTISVFQIDPATGLLTPTPGSPFLSGLTLDSCQGISLAMTPDGKLLMASSNGQIQSFLVAGNGVLTPGPKTANCCSPTAGMKISAQGNLLAVANETSVSVYSIHADGSLAPATGSPFPRTGAGLLTAVDFSCAADRLFGSESSFAASTITDAWAVTAGGILTPVASSPFLAPGTDSTSVVLSPDNSTLFTNDSFGNKITSFHVNADGSLAKIGSFGGVATVHAPLGLATDASGSLLYVADDGFGIAVFKISGTGSLTAAADLALNRVGAVQGLAAYPPRSCVSGDLALSMTAAPATVNAGSNVTYTITITNNGSAPASATIVDNLPSGESFVSCSATGGVCSQALPNPHTITFTGLAAGASQTVALVAQTSASLLNGATVNNTATLGNKSIIDTNPANDSASASITISAQPGPTTLAVSPSAGSYGGVAVLTATLQKTSNGALLSGKSVSFTLNGVTIGTAVTNNVGQAILTVSIAGLPLGTYAGAVGASFAGDTLFNPSAGSSSLTVNKAVLTVIASSANKVYGDPNPPFTYAITGFLNGDTAAVVSGTTTCNAGAGAGTPVGRYPVTCDLGTLSAANYTFVTFPGTLNVAPAPLAVAAVDASRVYGDPNPAFTGTITGLKNGDIITASFFSNANGATPVGTYPILPLYSDPAGVLSNYAPLVSGTLTITPATLSVTPNDASRLYGDPNPAFTGVISGLKNADKISATYASPALPASPVGTYPIVPTLVDPTGRAGNYIVSLNNGTLTITPAPLTVQAANASRLYGDPNPVFTGTITGIKNADAITATYSTSADPASPAGVYAIVPALVDPAGKLSNYAVTSINGVLTINPAPLSVTANNTSRNYGNANPAFTGLITGLKNADPITANFSTKATPASLVGAYPITFVSFNDPAGKLGNYTVTSVKSGTLTITRAPLTVAGFNGSRLYGDPNPAPVITGLKNADPITATYDATAPGPTAAAGGTFNLTPVLSDPAGMLSNYNVTVQNGRITINKTPLAVVANNLSRQYGSANPTLTGTITGVKNGENITPAFTTTATQTSNAGTFAITAAAIFNPTTLSANYTLTTTNGTLTITAVPLTVAANSQTVILNGSLPCTGAACATYTGFVLGQTPANLAGTLSCSIAAGTGNVGSSAINCSGQSSTNYAISFTPGTATVIYQLAGVNCTNGPGHTILAPVSAAGTTVFTKATTPTIAVQFRVCGVSGASVSSAGVVSSFVLTAVNGVPASTPAPQGGPFVFVGGTLANGAGSAGWQFNLSTSNLAAGNTYVYRINLNDGTSITFQFKLQ